VHVDATSSAVSRDVESYITNTFKYSPKFGKMYWKCFAYCWTFTLLIVFHTEVVRALNVRIILTKTSY